MIIKVMETKGELYAMNDLTSTAINDANVVVVHVLEAVLIFEDFLFRFRSRCCPALTWPPEVWTPQRRTTSSTSTSRSTCQTTSTGRAAQAGSDRRRDPKSQTWSMAPYKYVFIWQAECHSCLTALVKTLPALLLLCHLYVR